MKKGLPVLSWGFTLIELLVVIAIIGILATMTSISYPNYLKRARDTQRKSDLKQYQVALETYANKNNSIYPLTGSGRLNSVISGGSEDPKNADDGSYYKYFSDASGLNYVVWAKMEKPSTGATGYWISCANGKTGESPSVPDINCSSI